MKRYLLLLSAPLLFAVVSPSRAAEPDLQALLQSHQHSALEVAARARLARDPSDDAALWAWGVDAAGEPGLRLELLARTQDCVRANPRSARCHNLLGVLIASRLMQEIDLSPLGAIGEIREHFEAAVTLAPQDYSMRHDLQAFYLEVPGVLGGSYRKAVAQAEALLPNDPQRAALLRASIAISDKRFDRAESLLAGVQPGADVVLAGQLRDVQSDFGIALIEADYAARARAWFERLLQQDPQAPELHARLGRALLASRQGGAALVAFDRAMQLDPRMHLQHRVAAAAEAAGEKAMAVNAWQHVLADPAEAAHADQARERLDALRR